MQIDFKTKSEMLRWRPVNDGVMGGRSSGGPKFLTGNMIFTGEINTNGGGFSSIRRRVEPRALSAARFMSIRMKSDGRDYKLTFRTDVAYRGRRISFQKPIPATEAGSWQIVTVPLSNMRASLFGRSVSGAEFDPSAAVEMGIILADGQDGPFELEIDWIKAE